MSEIDDHLRQIAGLLQRVRDDAADLEQHARNPHRVVEISRDIDQDVVNAINLLQRVRRSASSA